MLILLLYLWYTQQVLRKTNAVNASRRTEARVEARKNWDNISNHLFMLLYVNIHPETPKP
jgi:hypothetical protein